MSHRTASCLYWSPRVLAIAFALFRSLFALDALHGTHGFWTTLSAFSIHLVPAAMIVIALLAAWRWEWIGAWLFAALAAFYAWEALPRHLNWAFAIDVPLLLIAALFLANWVERPKMRAVL